MNASAKTISKKDAIQEIKHHAPELKALVIDSYEKWQGLTAAALEDLIGYENVQRVDTINDALSYLEDDEELKLVILGLPDISQQSLEMVRFISAYDHLTLLTYVSALTAREMREVFRAGADDCVSRPYGKQAIYQTIVDVLGSIHQKRQRIEDPMGILW